MTNEMESPCQNYINQARSKIIFILASMSLCQTQDCAYKLMVQILHIVLWCGRLGKIQAETQQIIIKTRG